MFPALKLEREPELIPAQVESFATRLFYWFAISPFTREQTNGQILVHNRLFPFNIETQHSFRFGKQGVPMFTFSQTFKQSVGSGCCQWTQPRMEIHFLAYRLRDQPHLQLKIIGSRRSVQGLHFVENPLYIFTRKQITTHIVTKRIINTLAQEFAVTQLIRHVPRMINLTNDDRSCQFSIRNGSPGFKAGQVSS